MPGGFTHLFVAVNKFTKWIEAKLTPCICSGRAVVFIRDIISRFGVPNSIITDNGTQFTGHVFREFCEEYHFRLDFASMAHPRTHGQVERANRMVLQGLKPRIHDSVWQAAGRWVKELLSVLWGLRTTPNRTTAFTPFFMTFGAEAVLPTDLDYDSLRVRAYDEQRSEEARQDALDQLDEACDVAILRLAKY